MKQLINKINTIITQLREVSLISRGLEPVREVYKDIKLMTSYSHNVPNLLPDEVYGNVLLRNITEKMGYQVSEVNNIAYDNYIPSSEKPPAHSLQLPNMKVRILPKGKSNLPLPYQDQLRAVNINNLLSSDGKQKHELTNEQTMRLEEILQLYNKHSSNHENVTSKVLNLRREILENLLGLRVIPEITFTSIKTTYVKALETLNELGHPLHELVLDENESRKWTPKNKREVYLLKHVGEKEVIPLSLMNNKYVSIDKSVEYGVDDIYREMIKGRVIPSLPTIILAVVVAPQIPHLGGAYFKRYAPGLIHSIARAISKHNPELISSNEVKEYERLILTTDGLRPYRVINLESVFACYPLLGKDKMVGELRESL